jgi:universal stress protein A
MDNGRRVVLAPTDMSALSVAAVSHGAALAQEAGATLVLFTVITPREAEEGLAQGRFLDTQFDELRSQLLWWFTTFVPAEAREGVRVQALATVGHPEQEIIAAAESLHAWMIVIATHGRTGLRRALFGSVAEAVLRHALCPVITVRRPAPGEPSVPHRVGRASAVAAGQTEIHPH